MFEFMSFIFVPAIIFIFIGVFVAQQFKRCPSNRILVKFGKISGNKACETYHGGGTFIIPLIQDFGYLSLEPMSIDIDLKKALSSKNIRVNVPATFTIGISTRQEILNNAAERLLGLPDDAIKQQASEIIYGQLREVIATMTIEEINRDRDKFISKVSTNVDSELKKIGLEVINVNITDITDESGYIEAIGKKAAAEAIQQAYIDVAEQEKKGAIGKASAQRDQTIGEQEAERGRRIRVAELNAEIIKGENTSKGAIAADNATLAEQEAQARLRAEVARAKTEEEIFRAQKERNVSQLRMEQLAQEEVQKQKVEVNASAQASQVRLIAQGEADAMTAKANAQANAIFIQLEAKANGYKKLIEATGSASAASNMLLIEKMEAIIQEQVKALEHIKIDKITVWDNKGDTKNFIKDLLQMAPPLHEITQNAGLKLPDFLGTLETPNQVK